MSNNDYWNEKENEKYQKMKVEMEYNNLDFSKVKKFSGGLNKIVKCISIIAIIIGIASLVLVATFITLQWSSINKQLDPDLTEDIEAIYGEKFNILEERHKDKLIIYKLSPKSNKNIEFSAYKQGASTNEDYTSQAYKYFVENILDEEVRNKLTINSQINTINGESFLTYSAALEPANFGQIEEYTELMWKIRKIGEKQNKRVYSYITTCSMIKIGNYYSSIQYANSDLQDLKKKEKYQYINYLKENNLYTDSIPKEELEKYKPQYLHEVVNGKEVEESEILAENAYCAEYDETIDEYTVNLINMLRYLEGVKLNKALTGEINSFEYNGKEYKINYLIHEVEGKTFPIRCKISYLEEYFNANIEYDYENKKIYINIVDK